MLNKRKCRKFADPDLKIVSGSGILHAGQIDYIIRTAVKMIDHHRTLILYIYPRTEAAQGGLPSPMDSLSGTGQLYNFGTPG